VNSDAIASQSSLMAAGPCDHPRAIAEDALALLDAFVVDDADELAFRALLLSTHAERLGAGALADASDGFLGELKDGGPSGHGMPSVRALHRVIAAAADTVMAAKAL
jgi:hypothetical protein